MKALKLLPVILAAMMITSCGSASGDGQMPFSESPVQLSSESSGTRSTEDTGKETDTEATTTSAEESTAAETGQKVSKIISKTETDTGAGQEETSGEKETSRTAGTTQSVATQAAKGTAQPETTAAAGPEEKNETNTDRSGAAPEAEAAAKTTVAETKEPQTTKPAQTTTAQAKEPETSKATGSIVQPETTTAAGQRETEPETTAHVHVWQEITETVHHDAMSENVWVVDQAAWTETVTETVPVTEDVLIVVASCRGCGARFESEDVDEALENCNHHIKAVHGNACGYGTEQSYHVTRQVGTTTTTEYVQHPEEGHYETRVVSQAWDETVVTGYRCSCGSTK